MRAIIIVDNLTVEASEDEQPYNPDVMDDICVRAVALLRAALDVCSKVGDDEPDA